MPLQEVEIQVGDQVRLHDDGQTMDATVLRAHDGAPGRVMLQAGDDYMVEINTDGLTIIQDEDGCTHVVMPLIEEDPIELGDT